MSEEAAVIEKPVRPGKEGGRKKKDSGSKLVGEGHGEEGRSGVALGKMRST